MNENYTIDELLHNASLEDEDKELCKLLAEWKPSKRKIIIFYDNKNDYTYHYLIKILDKGITESNEKFKSISDRGKRIIEIMTDYYGKEILYDNKKRQSKELKFIINHDLEDNTCVFYEGFILRDYEE